MKFKLTYSQAREAVDKAIYSLPSGRDSKIKNCGVMFNDTLEPQDLVAMAMVQAGFDTAILEENTLEGYHARLGNHEHLRLSGYEKLFFTDNEVMGSPNLAVKCYLGRVAQLMDSGSTAGYADKAAQRWTELRYAADPLENKEDIWGFSR